MLGLVLGLALTQAPQGLAPPPPPPPIQADVPAQEDRRVWFDEELAHPDRWSVPHYKNRGLTADEFFHLVGRPELADSYETRTFWKAALKIVGGTLLLIGGTTLYIALLVGIGCSGTLSCSGDSLLAVGAVGTAAGAGMTITGFLLDSYPVDGVEERRMATEYNRNLWRAPTPSGRSGPRSPLGGLRLLALHGGLGLQWVGTL